MQYQSLVFSKFEQISANVVFATLLLYFGYPRKSIFSSSVMSTKVIFRRTEVFVLAEVCLPRRPHTVLPRSQVLSEKRKWRRTGKAN